MKDWLTIIGGNVVVIINAIALVIIVIGTIEAFFRSIGALLNRSETSHQLRDGYLRYAHWLITGLSFQLAADIIETAITPIWDEIGRLGVVALIRTFLNFFLERDLAEAKQ